MLRLNTKKKKSQIASSLAHHAEIFKVLRLRGVTGGKHTIGVSCAECKSEEREGVGGVVDCHELVDDSESDVSESSSRTMRRITLLSKRSSAKRRAGNRK